MISQQLAFELLSQCPNLRKTKKQNIQIYDCSAGVDQQVKIVHIVDKENNKKDMKQKNCKFIIKFPKFQPDKILNQVIGCEYGKKQNVPVPKILYYNQKYLVQSFEEGIQLKKIQTSKRNFYKLYHRLGQYLKKFHKNKGQGFGKITKYNKQQELNGMHKNKNHIKQNIQAQIRALKTSYHYTSKFVRKIQQYVIKTKNIIQREQKQTSLLHGDVSEDNILATKKQINSIIDFGDLCMGSPMEDFARLFVHNYGTYKWDALVNGYGFCDIHQIKFYALALCLWQINGCLQKQKYRGKIRQLQKALKIIINFQ